MMDRAAQGKADAAEILTVQHFGLPSAFMQCHKQVCCEPAVHMLCHLPLAAGGDSMYMVKMIMQPSRLA